MAKQVNMGALALVLIMAGFGCHGIVDSTASRETQATMADDATLVINGVRAALVISPDAVSRGQSFHATMTLTNTLARAATWTSGMGCLAFLDVFHDGLRVPVRGTDFGCLAVVTIRELQPGETIAQSWELGARTTDGDPLATGEYVLRADPVVADHETLSVRFVVR